VRYADLLAREELGRRTGEIADSMRASLRGGPNQRIAWLKRIWWRQPLFVRPFLYFLYRYVLRLGFLDGKEGLVFHFFQGCWFRLLVDVKLDEMMKGRDCGEAIGRLNEAISGSDQDPGHGCARSRH